MPPDFSCVNPMFCSKETSRWKLSTEEVKNDNSEKREKHLSLEATNACLSFPTAMIETRLRKQTSPSQKKADPFNNYLVNKSPPRRHHVKRRKGAKSSSSWNPRRVSLGVWGSRGLLLLTAAIYSTNFASIKYLETLGEQDPSESSFCRFLMSALVCLPILYSNRKSIEVIQAGVEVGFWFSVNYICQAESLEYIPAGKCAFIAALAVVTVPFFSRIFLGTKIHPMSIVSACVALFGVAILENVFPIGGAVAKVAKKVPSKAASRKILGIGLGDMLALGQPIGFGFAIMRVDYYTQLYPNVPNRVLTMTAAQMVTVCCISFFWVLLESEGTIPDFSYMIEIHHIVALVWTGIVTTVGACVLQGIALEKASATDAALIFSSEPVWGSIFAGWLLKERMTTTTYIGGFFILLACILGSLTGGGHGGGDAPKKKRKEIKSHMSDVSLSSRSVDGAEGEMLLPTRHFGSDDDGFDRAR